MSSEWMIIAFLNIYLTLTTKLAMTLECYECVGSESSDCARGVATAAVAANCTPRILRPISRTYLRTGDGGTPDASTNGFRPLPAQEPFVPYPACVTFTKVPHNSRNVVVHKKCLVSGEYFCRDYFMLHPQGKCRQCNHTNFCV